MSELSSSDTPVLDLLASMTADSVEASSLDVQAIMLVRLAALVASGAPAASYALNLAAASDAGLDVDDVRGVLTAIAPIVGTARVVAATGRIALALEIPYPSGIGRLRRRRRLRRVRDPAHVDRRSPAPVSSMTAGCPWFRGAGRPGRPAGLPSPG